MLMFFKYGDKLTNFDHRPLDRHPPLSVDIFNKYCSHCRHQPPHFIASHQHDRLLLFILIATIIIVAIVVTTDGATTTFTTTITIIVTFLIYLFLLKIIVSLLTTISTTVITTTTNHRQQCHHHHHIDQTAEQRIPHQSLSSLFKYLVEKLLYPSHIIYMYF